MPLSHESFRLAELAVVFSAKIYFPSAVSIPRIACFTTRSLTPGVVSSSISSPSIATTLPLMPAWRSTFAPTANDDTRFSASRLRFRFWLIRSRIMAARTANSKKSKMFLTDWYPEIIGGCGNSRSIEYPSEPIHPPLSPCLEGFSESILLGSGRAQSPLQWCLVPHQARLRESKAQQVLH